MVAQERIHNQCLSSDPKERRIALVQLMDHFSSMPDEERAWNDLHRLTNDKDSFVRSFAAYVLGSVFSEVLDKQQVWDDLHRLTSDKNSDVRFSAASALGSVFSEVLDKQQACNDLHRLTSDEVSDVRFSAAYVLGSVFSHVPDKQKAWDDLQKLINDKDSDVRFRATEALGSVFSHVPDKQQAWDDLQKLINDNKRRVRSNAAWALGSVFSEVPDKQKAWNGLIRLTSNKDSNVRSIAAEALDSAFSQVPDKQKAWNDLHRLTSDRDSDVRSKAAYALGSVFSHVPDKQQAWNDLHRLTSDKDRHVKSSAAYAIVSSFSHVPDKQKAWNNLIRLNRDKDGFVSYSASEALGHVFFDVPDKQKVWNDLIGLISDKHGSAQYRAASALGHVFFDMPDKQQAWNDLHRLTNDKDSDVRSKAAYALGSVFSHVPDKQQVWNDLHRLTSDRDSDVRYSAAEALVSSFSHVPDKQQALEDLYRLTSDEDFKVRISSNHSLGRVSIFKASQAETDEDYTNELEKAIKYFENAAQESKSWNNPSKFCLPFYRSFYTIIFKKPDAEEEADKYLEEAKAAIEGSKSKELLFEAVENLSNALKGVQNLRNIDLHVMKGELNFYRKYCDQAAELLKDTDEKAPYATELVRKGLPILNRNLKEFLKEIQNKARLAYKESKGTDTEEIAYSVCHEVQGWEIGSQEEMSWYVDQLIFTLESNIPKKLENQPIFDKIEQIKKEKILERQYSIICSIVPLIPRLHIEREISDIKTSIDEISENVNTIIIKLDEIQIELIKGFEKLDILSSEIGGKEGKLIENFSKKIHELIEKRDKETLYNFLEEIHKKGDILTKEIEKSSVPLEEKEESKKYILNIGSVLDKVKHPIKSFGKNVTDEIIVSYTAKETVKLVFQLASMAALGFPIPTPILNLLSSMVEDL